MNRRCGQRCCISLLYIAFKRPVPRSEPAAELGALGGTRTPNLLIRSLVPDVGQSDEVRFRRSGSTGYPVWVP
jgi:hypothetical protein